MVDDSALMRRLLCDLLGASPEIEVVGTARDGREAVLQAVRLKPDVITLDVEMPEVSGLEALPLLLAAHEAPVIMVSALTQEGADVTLQALELGAVDFMPKPERNQLAEMRASSDLLVAKVLTAAQSRVRRIRRSTPPSTSTGSSPTTRSGKSRNHPRFAPPSQASPGGTTGQARGASDDQPVSVSVLSGLSCDRNLHGRPAGAQPHSAASDRAHAADLGRATHDRPVHRVCSRIGSIDPAR